MLLPKQIDIQKAKAQERKSEIDEGLILARRVDELRQMRLHLENSFEVWRKSMSDAIHKELNELTDEKDDMARQVIEARKTRDELLIPLNTEWQKIEDEKIYLNRERNEIFLDGERLKIESGKVDAIKEKLHSESKRLSTLKKSRETLLKEAEEIRQQSEYDHQKSLKDIESKNTDIERKMTEVHQLRKEYEVGLSTIEVREKQAEEKESELITRENDLARRVKNLQRAEELK